MQERNKIYDWIRVIATIFVVIGHSRYLNIQTPLGGVDYIIPRAVHSAYLYNPIIRFIRRLSGWVYEFHMPLFFILSGAVFALKPIPKLRTVLKTKAKRLFLPYFVYGLLYMLPLKFVSGFYINEKPWQVVVGFLNGSESGHLWFLPALLVCTIVFSVLHKVLDKVNINSNWLLLIISFILSFCINLMTKDLFFIKTGISYLYRFATGYVFEKEISKKIKLKYVVLLHMIIVVGEIICHRYLIINQHLWMAMGCVLTYTLAYMCSHFAPWLHQNKMWQVILKNSFYIYIFHDPLEYVILKLFFANNLLVTQIGVYLYVFMRTVGVLVLSIVFGQLVNRIKIRKYARSQNKKESVY